ncbi:hypothetical protein LJB82_01500 [Desulfovibrio sp. OttesenSCG-928-M16]|nr:hypothetical protein [Desulfovibrio sp. OttesenSCG-928-M16]
MEKIRAVHIGLVSSFVKNNDQYFVTLDNGVSAILEKPIFESHLASEVSFEPYSRNNAVAIITYDSGRTDWRPARVGVTVWGLLMKNNEAYDVREFPKRIDYSSEEYVSQLHNKGADADCIRVECLPAPSFYQLYFFSRFFKESYEALIGSMASSYDKAYTKPVYRVDIAYEQDEGASGYTVILIQKSRFQAQ